MRVCTIAAGFKDPKYPTNQNHRFTHYGVDFDSYYKEDFDVIASAEGTVIGVERNYNSIGGVVVIQYDNVFIPKTKSVKSLIFRYMHFEDFFVSKGDKVAPYQIIGTISGTHKWWNHIHLEIDTDTKLPFHTPQVSEVSSKLLVFKGANDKTMLDPIDVLMIGKKQTAEVHPFAIYVGSKDNPRYAEKDYEYKPIISIPPVLLPPKPTPTYQTLILPVNFMKITCSYKNKAYENLVVNGWKMGTHYGTDFCGYTKIYGSGNGTVLSTGNDSCFGNFVIVKYFNVYNHVTKQVKDVVFRYFHLKSVAVKVSQKITKDTALGVMGSTGTYATGVHCHIEADSDCLHYFYTPTIKSSTTFFRAGYRDSRDTTFNIMQVLHVKTSKPDNQTLSDYRDEYINSEDFNIPSIQ